MADPSPRALRRSGATGFTGLAMRKTPSRRVQIMTKSKVLWIVSLAAVLTTPTTSMVAWWSSSTVTLGGVTQLTGFLADAGRYYRDGYKFAVDRINEKGGVTVGGKA